MAKNNKISAKSINKQLDAFLFPATILPKSNNRKDANGNESSVNGAPYLYNLNGGGSMDSNKNIGNTLVPIAPIRIKSDIGNWRLGIIELENPVLPYRIITQSLFRDVALDPQVQACLIKRYNMTLGREFAFIDQDGNVDKEWTRFFQKTWFKDIIRFIMDAQFYGYSLISLGEFVHSDMDRSGYTKPVVVNRDRISPERQIVASTMSAPAGERWDTPERKQYHIWVPTLNPDGTASCGFGLFYILGQETIKLRDMLGDNTDFMQRYASPLLAMNTDETDEIERKKREKAMNTNASMGWFMLKMNEKVEILNGNSGSGYKSYGDFEQRIHKLIAKILLQHSDAIDSTPGKLGGASNGKESPSQTALYEVQNSDANFIEPIINNELLWRIEAEGIPLPPGLKFKFLNSEEENLIKNQRDDANVKISTMVKNFAGSGMEFDPIELSEVMGMKVLRSKSSNVPIITQTGKEGNL